MEVAGVVLSAIPICIDILEGCIKAGEHVAAFRQWNMRTEQHRRLLVSRKKDLESLLEALLLGTTELPEDPEMLYQFLKQDWHDEKYVDMLHELNEKHGDLWPDFQALLQDYYEELKHLVVRLGLASAENLDSIGFMLFAGIANSQQQSSNDLLEALKNAPAPRQGMQRFLAGIRFVLRREQSEKSLGGLGQRISELRYRLVHNAEMQVRKRQAKMMSNSAQSSRSRSHLEALYHCLDRTTRSVRKSSPLAMALGLSSSWNAPCDELKKKRRVSMVQGKMKYSTDRE
ncbi:uncharacterized protein RHO25_002262 [Cercospora beticola]|uniref:Fungal N-terminal domain-containing protein n=1 Tax=Cercospora beticola TaxID=122368 RepID=A0ABZ0NDN6_CERBT|nr:hypothetical protein RHO25_002262 [Cercospora beticola]